jgi:hypothetical protein
LPQLILTDTDGTSKPARNSRIELRASTLRLVTNWILILGKAFALRDSPSDVHNQILATLNT